MIDSSPKATYVSTAAATACGGRLAGALFVAVLLACPAPNADAEQGGWRSFLPFAGEEDAAVDTSGPFDLDAPPTDGDPSIEEEDAKDSSGWLLTSPFARVSWPEIRMPQVEWKVPWQSSDGEPGRWLSTPLVRARTTARNAMQRTRVAWNSTLERMKSALPGGGDRMEDDAPQLAAQTREVTFWERFLGPGEPEPEPDNVVEMMAQEPGNLQR